MSEKKIHEIPIHKTVVSTPSVPISGYSKIYPKANNWFILDNTGTESQLAVGWSKTGINIHLTTITDNVGIGTISPSQKLEVIGTSKLDDLIISTNKKITLLNNTLAPTVGVDRFVFYSFDVAPGNAAPHFKTEIGTVIRLFREVPLTTQLTLITSIAPVTADYAIQNLIVSGYGFVTSDEAQSFLSVVKNLQTRVLDLEARLISFGLLPAGS